MNSKPRDTSSDAWVKQHEALARLGPEGRVRAAIDLSEAVRAIQLDGIQARNPGWSRADAVRHLVAMHFGVDLAGVR